MKYSTRVFILIFGWLVLLVGLILNGIIFPVYWVIRYGWENTPFFHNVRAGAIGSWKIISDAWEI